MAKATLARLAVALLAIPVLASCTSVQIGAIEQHFGIDFTRADTDALLGLPNIPFTIADATFHPDGSVTTATAPSWSQCPAYHSEALSAGWSVSDWWRLDPIINRESRCIPDVHNQSGMDDSCGLLQLNMRAHRSWVGPVVDWDFNRLFTPWTNLRVGRMLYERARSTYGCGWQPWGHGC